MPKFGIWVAFCLAGLAEPALAQSEHNAAKIPDFSGGWARIGDLVETYEIIPGDKGGKPQTVDPKHPHIGATGTDAQWISSLDNPVLTPETRARLKTITDFDIQGISHIKDEGVCRPSGVPMLLNRRGSALQMLQTPHEVVIMNARDQQIRHVYLDVPHSKTPPKGNAWYGESVGHYEGGDTLVVDTIGQNDLTQVDRFGTPHSDQIHVVERYRLLPDGKTIETTFTVTDPGAFTMPWSGMARFERRPLRWEEEICAENNRFVGTVTYKGVPYKGNVPTPVDLTPDF